MNSPPFFVRILVIFFYLLSIKQVSAQSFMGDVNDDGKINLLDFVKVVNHIQGTEFLTETSHILQADINGDGLVNSFDLKEAMEYRSEKKDIPRLPLATVLAVSPYEGEAEVSLTREFVVRFTMPLSENANLDSSTFFASTSGGERKITSARISKDRMKATLFLSGDRWPSSSKVTITMVGNFLLDALNRQIDIDEDGTPGGTMSWNFSTVATSGVDASTSISGYVYDSDSSSEDIPLSGVVISVPGNEEDMTVITDASGYFKISPAPVGRFFVNVDGRLVGAEIDEKLDDLLWKERDYYAYVGKAWETIPGKECNATLYGSYDENGVYLPDPRDGKIYLPLIRKGTLKEVNTAVETKIDLVDDYLEDIPEETRDLLKNTSLTIPPGALISDDGTTGGSVGIAPVSSDRLPEPLPNGLALPLVITIQTDGATNFDIPIPATFPNADNLPPGSKSALWSFDHDKGKWEISGPMTVSDDGLSIKTDPGVGIRQPGWHGSSPGAQIFGQAAFCGPKLDEISEGGCLATEQSIEATELELLQVARNALNLKESFYKDDFDFSVKPEPLKIIELVEKFLEEKSDENLEAIIQFNNSSRSLDRQNGSVSESLNLWEDNSTWDLLIERADIIKEAADHCAAKKGNAGGQQKVTNAYQKFSNNLRSLQKEIQRQLVNYRKFQGANNGLMQALENASSKANGLKVALNRYKESYSGLQGGTSSKRMDKLAQKLIDHWHNFLDESFEKSLTLYKGESFLFLKRIGSDREENASPPIAAQRIRVGKGGAFDAIVRPNSVYEVWVLEPNSLKLGGLMLVSPRNGGSRTISPIPICPDQDMDSDDDSLSDRGERIVGTDPQNPDTDHDQFPDGQEILNGTDPNGGNPVFTGILASAESSSDGFSDKIITENGLAFLGNGLDGVDCFDIESGIQPLLLSSVKTSGKVKGLSYEHPILAVAEAHNGVSLIDFSDPASPVLLKTHQTSYAANCVALSGGILFIGMHNGEVISIDTQQGYEIDRISFKEEDKYRSVDDIFFYNGRLYILVDAPDYRTWGSYRSFFYSTGTKNGLFEKTDTPPDGQVQHNLFGYRPYKAGRRFFIADDYAYISYIEGFNYIPSLLQSVDPSNNDTASIGWRRFIGNGSGLALSVEAATSGNPGNLSIYTVKEDGSFLNPGGYLENFETTLSTPGDARDVAVYNGLAYVADGFSGLQVVSYRSYEIGNTPPELEVRANDSLGLVEEGTTFFVRAITYDDIQVKNVEFFINGERVKVDGGYPFTLSYEVPLLSSGESNFTLEVIAHDTGGNFSSSGSVTYQIAEDVTPPRVLTIALRQVQSYGPTTLS